MLQPISTFSPGKASLGSGKGGLEVTIDMIGSFDGRFMSGPVNFVEDVTTELVSLGADPQSGVLIVCSANKKRFNENK